MKKDYVVYSLRLANELTNKGFKLVNTGINIKNPKYFVFFFENTKELRDAI
jgi:hypothetical protein